MPPFHYNPDLFWDANPRTRKRRFQPGPNNPVGVVWIDLSKEHYGIHGTPEPSRIGHVQSHGCVRLTNWDVQRVAEVGATRNAGGVSMSRCGARTVCASSAAPMVSVRSGASRSER